MAIDSRTTEHREDSGGQHDRLRRLGKYSIRKRLGAGGMGTVFLAVDEQLNRTVALKVLPHERAENPTLVKRFKMEAQAAAQLEHKNIVKIYEAGEIDGFLYLALEYVEGIDVHELVVKRGVLPVKRSIDIVRQIALALDHAASKQIVHRDIKPANLIIKRDGTVKLADMGLARSIDETTETNITRAGMTVGTVDYMSPEQARSSQSADVKSDIYSLGCTWYHMLTGEPPFPEGGLTEKLQAHAAGARPDPRTINPAVPEAVVAVLHRMMARKPDDRYESPQELLDDLELASKSMSALGASMLDALAEESSASSRRQERTRTAGAGAALPPKEPFKPVDLTSGRSIDIDIIRFAIPATLVILVLSVLVWALRSGGNTLSGGAGTAGDISQLAGEDGADRDLHADANRPAGTAAAGADTGTDDAENHITSLSQSLQSSGPPSVVGIQFPGAEDAATTAEGVRLIPDWVSKFRQTRSDPVDTITLSRRPSGSNEYRRLNDALKALPSKGGTIKINGDGPFALEPAAITSRGEIRLVAAEGRHPVIYLPASDPRGATDAYLTVRASQLEIDDCHFVMVDPPVAGAALIEMERGDLSLRNCSFTVPGGTSSPVTAIVIDGQARRPSSARSRSAAGGSSRCLLENVVCRGDRLTAVDLRGESSELVAGNCMFSSGAAPTVVLTDAGGEHPQAARSAGRRLRLLATTMVSGHSAVEFVQGGSGRNPTACDVVVRKSLLAYQGDSRDTSGRAMVTFIGGKENTSSVGSSDAIGVDWSTEDSIYLNWPMLVYMSAGAGTDLITVRTENEWRKFWDKPLRHDTVAASTQRLPGWEHPAAIRPQDVSAEMLARATGLKIDPSAGCDPEAFDAIPAGMIEHVIAASGVPDDPDGIGELMAVDESHLTFDITRARSLDRFLESDACPDGAHVLVTGSGLRKMNPVEIVDKSIRLEFQTKGGTPLVIQVAPGNRGSEPPAAAITVRNGAVDLVGAQFKMPAGSEDRQPSWLLQLHNASASVRGCTIEGPSIASEGHAGLIRFADGEDPGATATDSRHVLIEDSFLISPGRLLSGPVRWETLTLRNSVFVTQGDVLTLRLDEPGLREPSTALISHCTFSAGGAALRFVGQPLPTGSFSPLNVIVTESVFAGPVAGDTSASTVISRESESQTANHVRWWGNANGFAPTLGRSVLTEGDPPATASFEPQWAMTWGAGHEAHPLFGPTDVIFEQAFPAWTKLEPKHFAFNSTAPAATWGADGSPIGAHTEVVGAARDDGSQSQKASPRSVLPGRGNLPGRPNRRNPF